MCVILEVDGLQKLDHVLGSKSTPFYETIAALAQLVNSSTCFCIAIGSATVFSSVQTVLSDSPQRSVFMNPPALDPSCIFDDYNDDVVRLLVGDMGGHGRTLEALEQVLEKYYRSDKDIGFIRLMHKVYFQIQMVYPDIQGQLLPLDDVLKAVIARKRVSRSALVGSLTVDQIISMGLFRYDEESSVIVCPFILYLFVHWKGFPLVKMRSYAPVESHEESQPWELWEEFNCRFRVLKSQAYSGQTLAWNVLHSGAKFGNLCSIEVTERELAYSIDTHRLSTKSLCLMQGSCSCGLKHRLGYCIQPAPGSESGDCFICLESERGFLHEVHQYIEKTTGSINLESFREERAKAASSHDLFMLFCTGKIDFDLSSEDYSAVVDESCWKDYYGPFVSRLFYIKTVFVSLVLYKFCTIGFF